MILCNVRSSAIFLDYSSCLIIWTACLTVFMSDFTAGAGGGKVPWFHATPTNVSFVKGDKAVLQCIVENLGTRTVIWRKQPYGIPISVGKGNFVKIDRFHIHHEETNKEWDLIIKNVQVHDSGVYECQVSSKDKMFRRNVTLTVLDNRPLLPYIMISGNHFVEKGSAIYLTCNASTSDYPAGDVDWFKDGNIINTSGNGRLEIKQDISYKAKTIFSVLTINKATMDDSGTYVCRTSDLLTTRHKVDVLNTRTNNVKREQGSSASNKLMDGRSNCDLVAVYMSSYFFLVPSLLCYIFIRYILLYI